MINLISFSPSTHRRSYLDYQLVQGLTATLKLQVSSWHWQVLESLEPLFSHRK